ncbi:MAG: Sua5/YciO/YrdC/YwlC family protein, partial [Burkholderiaceae bacterium]|jgi:tRNA A37 threonylcarbamoyladenosine synthetase subunit TsaC/SUA5/YrdC
VPNHAVVHELLALHMAPLLATTLIMPGDTLPLNDPQEIRERLLNSVNGVIDAGACALEPTTVLDLTTMQTGGAPQVVRDGAGDWRALGIES